MKLKKFSPQLAGSQWGIALVSKQLKKCQLVSKLLEKRSLVSKQQKISLVNLCDFKTFMSCR